MELKDLFVSHKQVQPVSTSFKPIHSDDNIYLNFDRAKKAVSENSDDMSTWVVGNESNDDVVYDWRVGTKRKNSSKKSGSAGSWDNPYKNDRDKWVRDMTEAYKRNGVSDNGIKNLIAKNAFESGWGNSAQGAYNFGNITAGSKWQGDYYDGKDVDADGNPITNRFRAYSDLDSYVKDELQFLTSLYDFDTNDDFETFAKKLQGGNKGKRYYAEDRKYIEKMRGVYKSV